MSDDRAPASLGHAQAELTARAQQRLPERASLQLIISDHERAAWQDFNKLP